VKVSRTSLPEEGEFEMDLEVGQQASSRLPAQGEFEMDLELETSPHTLVSRKVPVFSSFKRGKNKFVNKGTKSRLENKTIKSLVSVGWTGCSCCTVAYLSM
jgi:hypothetical protein